jgi:hypothetical protein
MLGDGQAAAATGDLIAAIERIGNAYRVNDRLIAIYYVEHGLRRDDALRIARRDAATRGDEIYAQDTLAWAAAGDGHWTEARGAMAKAIRYDTQDPRLQFHAGMIALHFGDRSRGEALAWSERSAPQPAASTRSTPTRPAPNSLGSTRL